MKPLLYYSLLERTQHGLWQIAFGDYDKAVVVAERDERVQSNRHHNRKLVYKIAPSIDLQHSIEAVLEIENVLLNLRSAK